jgi:predicted amidophosphoribosyltransferase
VLLDRLLHAVAPPLCVGCGASAGAAEPLCGGCRGQLRWLGPEPVRLAAPPVSRAAAWPSAAFPGFPGPDPVDGPGSAAPASLLAWAPLAYEGPAQGVVRGLKFKGAHRAARAMAAQIVANAPPGWLEHPAALVPVPLHPKRARTRGYNQARLLAEAIASRSGLAVFDCLARDGPSRTQVGRDRAQRLTGIAGRVHATRAPPSRAILVDDVITTGATLLAAAEAAGAAMAVAYARTPGR